MKKKIISAVLILALICTLFSFSGFASENLYISKMSIGLQSLLQEKASNDVIDVAIWRDDIDWESVEKETYEKTGLYKEDITDDLGIEKIQNYIATKRSIAIQKYKELNQTNKNALLSENSKVIFQSNLAPLSIVSMAKSDILALSKESNIQSIELFENREIIEFSDIATYNSGATYIRGNGINATGAGVNIGMVELGIPDADRSNAYGDYFDQSDMHLVSTGAGEREHATLVAAIMVGRPTFYGIVYQGIAPDADLYYAGATSITEYYQQIENLVAQNVNIINMSSGFDVVGNIEYDDFSKWIDHLAFQHDVHFVQAAGNYGTYTNLWNVTGMIGIPGMAYNAIVVGAYDDNNYQLTSFAPSTLSQQYLNSSYFEIADFSSYNDGSNLAYKPDLVASGVNIRFAELSGSGTSFAAPQVSATIAQLCDLYPSLLTNNSGVKAILTAGAAYRLTGDYSEHTNTPHIFEKQGAGVYSAYTARNIIYAGKWEDKTLSSSFTQYEYPINIPDSYTYIRISLCWIKKNSVSGSHTSSGVVEQPLADLELQLIDPQGNVVATSDSPSNNMEIIQYPLPESNDGGTYKIRIINKSYNEGLIGSQYISFAWY